jgi:hypothetical protein
LLARATEVLLELDQAVGYALGIDRVLARIERLLQDRNATRVDIRSVAHCL